MTRHGNVGIENVTREKGNAQIGNTKVYDNNISNDFLYPENGSWRGIYTGFRCSGPPG